MLALVLAMLFCVAVGTAVVGYVLLEARRDGRGEFWTAEGEELIAGARRTGGQIVSKGGELATTATQATQSLVQRGGPEAGRPSERGATPAAEDAASDPDPADFRRAS